MLLVYILPGSLQSFVTDKDKNGPLLFDKVVDFSYQLFSALEFLHSIMRILHRNIKRMIVVILRALTHYLYWGQQIMYVWTKYLMSSCVILLIGINCDVKIYSFMYVAGNVLVAHNEQRIKVRFVCHSNM